MADLYKTITMPGLLGIFDARSSVDLEPVGAFTWKQNFEVSPDGKLRQAHGFVKPYAAIASVGGVACPYRNWDFHDQANGSTREPITLLFPSTTNDGERSLFLTTKTRIAQLDESGGSWNEIGSGYGNDGSTNLTQIRFKAAELQDKVFFTNDFDAPLYYDLVAETTGALNGGAMTINKAKVIIQWQGVIMLMNVVEDGTRYASRIRWSNMNDGTDFDNSETASISDYQDLTYGQRILNAVALLGSLYIFTDTSIWRCNFAVDQTDPANPTAILTCSEIYSDARNQNKCLAFPNSLISTGKELYYAGRDAIYEYDPYQVEPQRLEWIYRSSSLIFESGLMQIDKSSCESPVAEYCPDTGEIHFSWPVPDAQQVEASSCDAPPPIISSGLNRHTLVMNVAYATCDYRDYGTTAFVNFRSGLPAGAGCNQNILFLGANGMDYCLKQFGIGYGREIYDPSSGTHTLVGYYPLLRGVFPFGKFDTDKSIKSFTVDGAVEADVGTVFKLRIGTSYQVQNPNNDVGVCGVVWRQLTNKPIKCLMAKTPAKYVETNTRPGYNHEWNFLYRGRFLYYELTVMKSDGTATNAGGVSLSRFEVKAIAL